MTRIPIDTPESATPMSRALGLMVLGGLVVALVVWAAGTVWAQKLDTARFRADSISRDALDRRLLEQSELTAGRVKAMYCARSRRRSRLVVTDALVCRLRRGAGAVPALVGRTSRSIDD